MVSCSVFFPVILAAGGDLQTYRFKRILPIDVILTTAAIRFYEPALVQAGISAFTWPSISPEVLFFEKDYFKKLIVRWLAEGWICFVKCPCTDCFFEIGQLPELSAFPIHPFFSKLSRRRIGSVRISCYFRSCLKQ